MRIGENIPIWVSHSPTIKDCKQLFFLSFKDIQLMYYVLNNNPYLLLKTNNNTSKVYENVGLFLQYLMFGDIIYKLDVLYSPFLVQITNCLFKFKRNVAIIKKK